MRSIEKLVQDIKSLVPESFAEYDSLMHDLEDIVDSSHYRAPELMYLSFQQLGETLQFYLGEPAEKWKLDIAYLLAGKKESTK